MLLLGQQIAVTWITQKLRPDFD